MKIAYISGVKFGFELLSSILEKNWEISIVFSYEDSKKKIYSDYAEFDVITNRYKIKHVKVNNINDEKNIELLKGIKPDVILVMGWSQLLKSEILSIPRIGTIGSHPTELPKYRGRAPIPWSIIKGLEKSALTFFWMGEGIDEGDILDQRFFAITQNDDASSIYDKVTKLGQTMILENLPLIEKGTANRIRQNQSEFIEYWQRRTPEDGKIDWTRPGAEIHTLIRATTHPYPAAFTFFKNSKLKIWKARYLDEKGDIPGKIINVGEEGVKVSTGEGILLLEKVSFNDEIESSSSNKFSINDVGLVLG